MRTNYAVEIEDAIRSVQGGTTRNVLRHICIICKLYLGRWDVQNGQAVCWRCRKTYFPTPKVEEERTEPKKATLFQLKDGKYAIILD
jgi:hypothetical protein